MKKTSEGRHGDFLLAQAISFANSPFNSSLGALERDTLSSTKPLRLRFLRRRDKNAALSIFARLSSMALSTKSSSCLRSFLTCLFKIKPVKMAAKQTSSLLPHSLQMVFMTSFTPITTTVS